MTQLELLAVKPAYPLHDSPLRTKWQAARDLFEEACRTRNVAMWQRAYRLWIHAAVTRAPGEFFPASQYIRGWLP